MPFVAPAHSELLRGNRLLPDALKQRSVMLRFAQPIKAHELEEFLRVHLTFEMKADGEAEAYKPEVFQPHSVGTKLCPFCGRAMRWVARNVCKCETPRCTTDKGEPTRNLDFVTGPRQGIIMAMSLPQQFAGEVDEQVPAGLTWDRDRNRLVQNYVKRRTKLVSGCVVILDRRYDEKTLAAVYRTCGTLCEMLGWRLL